LFIVYFLITVLLIAFWITTSLYIVVWYDAVNFRTRTDEGEWRKGIRFFSIFKGVVIESLCLFFKLITTPLRFYFDRIPKTAVPDSRPPILFVHGWGSASHAFLLIYLLLKKQGFKNMYFMTYRPIFADARKLAGQVAEKIDFVREKTGAAKINVISHSMGGVLTRYAIKNGGADGKVEKLIALGGPHMGSRVAAFVLMGKNTLQMAYKSAFLTDLASGGMTCGDTHYVSIYSDFDNFIIPQDSSRLGADATNINVPFHGHIFLLYSFHVIRLIIKELRREI
jgi:triacylglycerol esterase/lipase EstA (alpha/beta hydrolase family)